MASAEHQGIQENSESSILKKVITFPLKAVQTVRGIVNNNRKTTIAIALGAAGAVGMARSDRDSISLNDLKAVGQATRNLFLDDGVTNIEEGTPKEPISLAPMELGNGLTCEGTVIFHSMGYREGVGDEYIPSIVLTIRGLPQNPNGTEHRVFVHCAAKASTVNGTRQRSTSAELGDSVDAETFLALQQRMQMPPVTEEENAELDRLVQGKLAGFEDLAHASPEAQGKLCKAIIARAMSNRPSVDNKFTQAF